MNTEKFELLEGKIKELIELYSRTKDENISLKAELQGKEKEIRILKEQVKAVTERKREAATRIKGLIEEIDALSA